MHTNFDVVSDPIPVITLDRHPTETYKKHHHHFIQKASDGKLDVAGIESRETLTGMKLRGRLADNSSMGMRMHIG